MNALEKLKELAVKQMRMAADLYETIENAEKELQDDNESYNKAYLRAQRRYREVLTMSKFELKVSQEENELWDELMEELD